MWLFHIVHSFRIPKLESLGTRENHHLYHHRKRKQKICYYPHSSSASLKVHKIGLFRKLYSVDKPQKSPKNRALKFHVMNVGY